jgi:peptidyl-prolyl cis-trans isomerase B (cyclophilin B)
MLFTVVFVLLSVAPSPQEALDAMLDGNPFHSTGEPVLIEFGDQFLVPSDPAMVKPAILRQFHRLAFQMQQEPVSQLAAYIEENWGYLNTETRNLWYEYTGRMELTAPEGTATYNTLTSVLRYCSESGSRVPVVETRSLTDLQRFYYVMSLSPDKASSFIDDRCWSVRYAVIQRNPTAAFQMLDDESPYIRMKAADAAGRADLLLELAAFEGPVGHMSLAEVGQVPILEDSLFGSADPAKRCSALVALLKIGWSIPPEKLDCLLSDDYIVIGSIAAESAGRNFSIPEEESFPGDAPALNDVPDRVVLVTDKGEFTLTLLKNSAPETCRSFWYLAESGFYDGVYFHRVIPGFVAQAGCPEGNGYGGPGYTIPAENNTVAFNRGVLGMADSGLDTGGSQFFIMLDSQRRLDCRYTAFAQVDNTDRLDLIEVGTRILEIRRVNT